MEEAFDYKLQVKPLVCRRRIPVYPPFHLEPTWRALATSAFDCLSRSARVVRAAAASNQELVGVRGVDATDVGVAADAKWDMLFDVLRAATGRSDGRGRDGELPVAAAAAPAVVP